MSAEAIARVIADFRAGRVVPYGSMDDPASEIEFAGWTDIVSRASVIDCTSIYRQFMEGHKEWKPYEDSVLRPPLDTASYAFVNDFGNVIVLHAATLTRKEAETSPSWPDLQWESQADHDIEWERVTWITSVTIWAGGWSKTANKPMETTGPVFTVFLAIYEDGSPGDIHWINKGQIPGEDPSAVFQVSMAIFFQAVTFLNCRNVAVVIPHRKRPVMRALQRAKVEIGEIHVYAVGRTVQGTRPTAAAGGGVPAHLVRGHLARYGDEYGRGKLFGKYSGIYWIPMHAKGDSTVGEREHTYTLEP